MRGRIALLKHFVRHILATYPATPSRSGMRRWACPGYRSPPGRGSRPRRRSCRSCGCSCRSSTSTSRCSCCSCSCSGWTRTRTRRSSRCGRWCWCRCATAALAWGLDFNGHRRASLKVTDCTVGSLWRLVGIEPEVIQCAKADGIGILVCGKGFRAPGNHAATLIDCPRRATIPQIVESPVVWPPRFLRRRMEPEVTDIRATHWHAKGSNSTIEVLVVKRILIVPDSGRRVGHLVTHEPDSIVARVGLHLCHCCAC